MMKDVETNLTEEQANLFLNSIKNRQQKLKRAACFSADQIMRINKYLT